MNAPPSTFQRRRRAAFTSLLAAALIVAPAAARAAPDHTAQATAETPTSPGDAANSTEHEAARPGPDRDQKPTEAETANPERLREAGQRYEAGLSLYSEGDFALAVIEFERAFSLVPDYRVLFNIGQVRIQLGQYARARRALEHYLREGADRIGEERRAAVAADLQMLAARTATLRVQANVGNAEIRVDDELVGRSPLPQALLLDAGEHRVVVRKPGYRTHETRVTLAGRDAEDVLVELQVLPARPPAPIVVTESRRVEDAGSSEAVMWAAWSATGALVVGASITGFLGIRAANELGELRSDPDATRGELDSAKSRARSLLITADVLGAAAVASGGIALYVTLSKRAPDRQTPERDAPKPAPEVGLAIGPGFTGLSGTY